VVFGSRLAAVLRFYLTFQFLSAHPTVLFSADGQSNVQAIFVRLIHHVIWDIVQRGS
jgi:hypothetical protein